LSLGNSNPETDCRQWPAKHTPIMRGCIFNSNFNAKQRAFLDFVRSRYITVGVEELDQQKLTPLLRLKYGAIQDAGFDLGQPEEIGKAFTGFQKYHYADKVA
jgi:type I restriction enzyme R subunit